MTPKWPGSPPPGTGRPGSSHGSSHGCNHPNPVSIDFPDKQWPSRAPALGARRATRRRHDECIRGGGHYWHLDDNVPEVFCRLCGARRPAVPHVRPAARQARRSRRAWGCLFVVAVAYILAWLAWYGGALHAVTGWGLGW